MQQPVEYDPITVFIILFLASTVCGFASLLSSDKPLTLRLTTGTSLVSGFTGTGIAMLWYSQGNKDVFFLLGCTILAVLSGLTASSFLAFFRANIISMISRSEESARKKDGDKP